MQEIRFRMKLDACVKMKIFKKKRVKKKDQKEEKLKKKQMEGWMKKIENEIDGVKDEKNE